GGAADDILLQDTGTGALHVWQMDANANKVGERQLDLGAGAGTLVVQRARRPDPVSACGRALYRDALGREAGEPGFNACESFLHAGGTRQQVAEGFWESAEHRGLQVDQCYATYLHRAPDAPGRAGWVGAPLGGLSEDEVARGFLTSE